MTEKIDPKVLEDGSVLRNLISIFMENRCEETLVPVLACLRDSIVWIPCTAILSDKDQEELLKNLEIGSDFQNKDPIRFVPDILMDSAGTRWFPIFTNPDEASEEYKAGFSFIPVDSLAALDMAKSHDTVGIVIDAQTLGLEIPFEVSKIIEKIKSGKRTKGRRK